MANKVSKELGVRATMDSRKFSTGIQNMQRDMRRVSKDVSQMSNVMKTALAGVAVSSIAATSHEIFNLVRAADQLNRKTATVFGQFDKTVTATAERIAASMGMTVDEFRSATVGTADLLVPLGFTREVSAGLATDLTKLSGALAEWNTKGLNATQVSEILTKTLLGEAEQIKQLGIVIRQDSSFQKLVKETAEATGQTEKQAKATLILKQIMEQSQDAQTAYANNSDSITRNSERAAAEIRQLKEDIVNSLIPAMQEGTIGAGNFVTGLIEIKDALAEPLSGSDGKNNLFGILVEWSNRATWAVLSFGLSEVARQITNVGESARNNQDNINKYFGVLSGAAWPKAGGGGATGGATGGVTSGGGISRSGLATELAIASPGLGLQTDGPPDLGKHFKPVEANLSDLSNAADNFGMDWQSAMQQLVSGAAMGSASIKDFVTNSVGALKDQAIAALIAKVFSDPTVPFFAALGIAAGASVMINGLFSSLMGGSGGGGGGASASRANYGRGNTFDAVYANDFNNNFQFTLEGTTLIAAINKTNGRLGRVTGTGG